LEDLFTPSKTHGLFEKMEYTVKKFGSRGMGSLFLSLVPGLGLTKPNCFLVPFKPLWRRDVARRAVDKDIDPNSGN